MPNSLRSKLTEVAVLQALKKRKTNKCTYKPSYLIFCIMNETDEETNILRTVGFGAGAVSLVIVIIGFITCLIVRRKRTKRGKS